VIEDGAQASVIAARSVSAEEWTGVIVVSCRFCGPVVGSKLSEHALLIPKGQRDGAA
jgi:hypothetical protein